jgi:hypothetical protein
MVDITEKYIAELERASEQTNENLKPLHKITLNYCVSLLNDDLYLPEIGDRLFKLSI